ncbi:MAG: helix-turn-helix domain-containing protein, partial [bacterium]
VEEHGYSHREVAAHLGIHYTTVSRIINEKWDDKQ